MEPITYSSGANAVLETTSLIGLMLLESNAYFDIVTGIINWLVTQKDSFGNWSTTQGTILALRLMVESIENNVVATNADVRILLDSEEITSFAVSEENSDVMRRIDLTGYLVDKKGEHSINIEFTGSGQLMYQAIATWYVPGADINQNNGPLRIEVHYDKTQLHVNDSVQVTLKITNISQATVAMVLASVGIPPGFDLIPDKLNIMVENGTLQKYETTPRQLNVYIYQIKAAGYSPAQL